MTSTDAIKIAMSDKKITQKKLAEIMGYSAQGSLGSRLSSNTISSDLLIEILDILDYEVVIQPKTAGKRKEGAIVLEASNIEDGRRKKKSDRKEA